MRESGELMIAGAMIVLLVSGFLLAIQENSAWVMFLGMGGGLLILYLFVDWSGQGREIAKEEIRKEGRSVQSIHQQKTLTYCTNCRAKHYEPFAKYCHQCGAKTYRHETPVTRELKE